MCPPGTFNKLSRFLLSEIPPAPARQLARDGLAHLRLHGALPLTGVLVTGAGAALYALMSAPLSFRVTWGLVGVFLVVAALVVLPSTPRLRGGCPYALEASPQTPAPRLRAVSGLTVPAGVALMASPLVAPSNPAPVSIPGGCGGVICGAGLLAIAWAARGGPRWFRVGVYSTALGAALIGYANSASAFVSATQTIDAVASLVSAAGLLLYAATARDLARLYREPAALTRLSG